MGQEFTDHMRAQRKELLALFRSGKPIAYWKNHQTFCLTEEAGALFYDLLGKKNGGWIRVKKQTYLNGCSCATAESIGKKGAKCRDFHLCPAHEKELITLLELAHTIVIRPMPPGAAPRRYYDSGPPIFGPHEGGVYVYRGGRG